MASKSIAVVVAVATSGCSFVFTKGPSATQPNQPIAAGNLPPDCTDSMAFPIIDGVLAVFGVMVATGAKDQNSRTNTGDKNGTIALGVIGAGVAVASAFVGYGRVTKCRRARESFMLANYGAGAGGYQQPQASQYPAAGEPVQPYPPAPVDTASPNSQPVGPTPPVKPPAPPVAPLPPAPPSPPPPPPTLGTEGDVCASQAECAEGFTCSDNVCLKKK